jgi:hypothetical protein
MTVKPQIYNEYSEEKTELAEKILLEVWACLGEFRKDMVLVGGLAPRYLVRSFSKGREIPVHCGTMDVDFGLSLAIADRKTYGAIRKTLVDRLGFRPGTNARGREQRHSFVKTVNGVDVNIDFLTAVYGGPKDSRMREMEEEISAIQVRGLGLALLDPLEIKITGKMLSGELTTETVNVCRPVPFVVLKSLSFSDRRESKDAYDLVYIIENFDGGPAKLAKTVREDEIKSEFWDESVESLRNHFESIGHTGPARYASFLGDKTRAAQAFAAVQGFLKGLKQSV